MCAQEAWTARARHRGAGRPHHGEQAVYRVSPRAGGGSGRAVLLRHARSEAVAHLFWIRPSPAGPNGRFICRTPRSPRSPQGTRAKGSWRRPVTQGKLSLGFRTGELPDRRDPAAWMFQTIYGGSTSSSCLSTCARSNRFATTRVRSSSPQGYHAGQFRH